MVLAGLPEAFAGTVIASSAFSVVVTCIGLLLLRATRPCDMGHGLLQLFGYRALGVIGALLVFIGLVLNSVPYLVGVSSDAEGKAAALISCSLVMFVWLGEKLVWKQPVHLAQTIACWLIFVSSILVEYAGPRPFDNMTIGFDSQSGGCDGRYRSPFLMYAAIWLTVIMFGALLLIVEETPPDSICLFCGGDMEEELSWRSSGSPRTLSGGAVRRRALPILYGLCTSMAGVTFAIGAASNQMGLVFFGACLLILATLCAWDWLWRLELPLTSWAPLSLGISALLRLIQTHLVFRDLRWDPMTEYGILSVWRPVGLPLFFLGFLLLAGTLLLFVLGGEMGGWLEEGPEDWGREELSLEDDLENSDQGMCSQECYYITQMVFLAICAICLIAGILIPMIEIVATKPTLTYVSPKHTTTLGNAGGEAANRKSMLDTISQLYTSRLPCSALVLGFTFLIFPPLQFAGACLLLLRPKWVPFDIYPLLRQTLLEQAPFRFTNPFVVCVLVAFLNFTIKDPTGDAVQGRFALGFVFILGYCFTSIILAQMMTDEGDLKQRRQHSGSEGDSDSDDDFSDGGEACAPAQISAAITGLILFPVVGIAMYFATRYPFFTFEYRVSSVAVDVVEPTVYQLYQSLCSTSPILGFFAAFSFLGTFLIWMFFFVVRIPFALGWEIEFGSYDIGFYCKRAEQLIRPWVMTQIWAMCIGCMYYVVTGRNKAIIEVCIQWPSTPLGIAGLLAIWLGMEGLKDAAKTLSPAVTEKILRKRPKPRLPGGICVWAVAPGITFVFWCVLLYNGGPFRRPVIDDLDDLNNRLETMAPFVTNMFRGKLPHSIGDCQARWTHNMQAGLAQNDHPSLHADCHGDKSLFQISQASSQGTTVNITVRWIEGLDTLQFDRVKVQPPPSSGLEDVQVWNSTIAASFTGLHIWLKVFLGDVLWVDDYMCCQNPFHFELKVSAMCDEQRGFFPPLKLEVSDMDDFNWVHRTNWQDQIGNSQGFTVDYGQHGHVEEAIREIIMGKTGRFWVNRPDGSQIDPLKMGANALNRIALENRGDAAAKCPHLRER
mmetsp:Transcript_115548/g.204221  ORF Transcript_115548/g.204221 Transcript_115548/m.204221 type:complete len:1057 (-) Transcript_115548:56-3226(-)